MKSMKLELCDGQIRDIVRNAKSIQSGIEAIVGRARQVPKYAELDLWKVASEYDFSADTARIEKWLRQAIKKLPKGQIAQVLVISLGDIGDVYQAIAWKCEGCEKGMAAMEKILRAKPYLEWVEHLINWGAMTELGTWPTSALPGKLWKQIGKFDSADIQVRAAEILWNAYAALCTLHVLKTHLEIAKQLGESESVPLFIGFNEAQEYYGSITRKGWVPALN